MGDGFEALARGGAQGATFGFGDEAVAKLLASLDGPKDPDGYSREYAAGSAEADHLQGLRGANATASRQHPWLYGAGSIAGAAPLAVAGSAAAGGAAAGAGLLGRIGAQAGVGAAQGALSGAGTAESGERLKHALVGGATGAAMGGAAEAAPAAISGARGLWARVAEPAAEVQPALAGASQMRAAPSARPTRIADRPAAGSIPPEYSMAIPKHDRPLVSESMLPTANDMADSAYEAVGQKKLAEHGVGRGVKPEVGARYAENARAMDEAYPLPKKAPANDVSEPVTGTRTVRPGKRVKAPKLPSEKGVSTAGDAQQPIEFPEPQSTQHWLEGELKKTGESEIGEPGINSSKLYHFNTPQGPKSAVFKSREGSMGFLGLPGKTLPEREVASHEASRALFKDNAPVPKTVVRDVEGIPGSLQEFVPNAKPAHKIEDLVPRPEARQSAATLPAAQNAYQGINIAKSPEIAEAVAARGSDPSYQRTLLGDLSTGGFDRHGKNLLEDQAGKAVAIDNGYSFPARPQQFRVPFESQKYLQNATDIAPEVNAELQQASPKEFASAANKPGITKTQQREALGRFHDLRSNPQQVKGLTDYELEDWLKTPYSKRNLPTSTLMDIEKATGGIPSKHITLDGPAPLPGEALEGEQLSLTDLLNKLR